MPDDRPLDKMHADELDIDSALVRRLLAAQFPQWAGLPLERVRSAGTVNAIYRLGEEMAVRLPRVREETEHLDKELRWLPRLAPHLPLAVPIPLAKGRPGEGYPLHWFVYSWLPGENAVVEPIADLDQAAMQLAQFIAALQRIDATGGPHPGAHNYGRGVPLAVRDPYTRAAIADLDRLGMIDARAATAAWEEALRAPAWAGPPVWIHGDILPTNLLVQRGRLSAVIDFGALGVGDPACDLQVAWNLLAGRSRAVFRAALGVDDAAWARGKGWALSVGLIALPYYYTSNPVLAGIARRTIDAVLADNRKG
jgi:aminoglycoside phosphotransferase (APT) family kinase protein